MVFASSRDIEGAQPKFQDGVPSDFYSKRGWIHCESWLVLVENEQKKIVKKNKVLQDKRS